MTVMRRPVPVATAVVVLLLVLGPPFLSVDLGLPDDRVLPERRREVPPDARDRLRPRASFAVVNRERRSSASR